MVAKLGPNAFQDMNWWAAVTSLVIVKKVIPDSLTPLVGVDVGDDKRQLIKAKFLKERKLVFVPQQSQLNNKNHVVSFQDLSGTNLLASHAKSIEGLSTGDGDRFRRKMWELTEISNKTWTPFHVAPAEPREFNGQSEALYWESGKGELSVSSTARIQGHNAWDKNGVLISAINRLKPSLYSGNRYDKMCVAVIPNKPEELIPIWLFCSSEEFYLSVRKITQKVHVATGSMLQVPFDLARWQKIESEKYPYGLPEPYSDDPTQWIFHGHPSSALTPNLR
jgi:hypothetical protein